MMGKYSKFPSNYDKRPEIEIEVPDLEIWSGWKSICSTLEESDCVIFDHYQGVR
jgi:hypothetical protein